MILNRKTIKQLVPTFETKQHAVKRNAQMMRALQRDNGRGTRIAEQWAALEVPLVPDPLRTLAGSFSTVPIWPRARQCVSHF
jgi:hypothetical protein